ncbi:Glycine/sarcosine N-methyltransferase [bioreactor metagenome]|uniref:Glycine/sarcosine N-methyltransferase n=1 Tax=bioreactor metagenome TaxID=1076179 RepID=A0A645APY1_9ZZZZ
MAENYYDELAAYYKLMYVDWEKSVHRQASALDKILKEYGIDHSASVLDAACGIGTQCLGLAELGYAVTASDLSAEEVNLAKIEAQNRRVKIDFQVADMRAVWQTYQKQFDVVCALDNAIPHLLSDEEILQAFSQFYSCTRPGGVCLISVRDYSQVERAPLKVYPRTVHRGKTSQWVLCDVWEFSGPCYEMTTYVIEDKGGANAQTRIIRGGKYYCIELPTLQSLLLRAGFTQVTILTEEFFQPLLVARKV